MKDIKYYIDCSNNYLLEHHPTAKPITLNDIKKRLQKPNFLGLESTKTKKGQKYDVLTAILYLAPYKITGYNVCPWAVTCIKDCLDESGRGKFKNVTRARIVKTLCFLFDRDTFIKMINKDIERYQRKAKKLNYKLAVRFNGTSDLNIGFYFKETLKRFYSTQFYDYTKVFNYIKNNKFKNYHFTFSYDGTNFEKCLEVLEMGYNVSIVFKNDLPKYFRGFEVIDGDKTDLRFLDKKGVFVGLRYKTTTNKDINKLFVVDA